MLAPLIDDGIHFREPALRPQHEIHHVAIRSGQMRRFLGVVILQQRILPARDRMMVRVALHVEEQPVAELPVGAPGMARHHLLPTAVRQAHPAQSVMLQVVADLHRKDAAIAEEDEDQHRPDAAHPENQPVPERKVGAIAPERIAQVPDRQSPARQPLAGHFPGIGEVADDFLGKVAPETLPLGRRSHVVRRSDLGVVDVDMFGRILRVGSRSEQEFAQPPLPGGAPVDHFVADDEDRLRFHRQHDRQQYVFPDREWVCDENLPHAENEGRGPEKRPGPGGQVVPEQAAFRRPGRIHVAAVEPDRPVERAARGHEKEEWRQQPPAAECRRGKNQRKNA